MLIIRIFMCVQNVLAHKVCRHTWVILHYDYERVQFYVHVAQFVTR